MAPRALEVADIAAEVTPSVVRVEVLRYGQVTGTGSGVIFRDDGHLITNTHVVDSGDSFQIVLADGAVLNVELVGMDRRTDVAVLRPSGDVEASFTPATLGRADNLRWGNRYCDWFTFKSAWWTDRDRRCHQRHQPTSPITTRRLVVRVSAD